MALRRANWWINLISVCEIQTDSQIRRKWPPHSLGSPRQCHPSPASTTEWAQRTGTVGQDACPHRSTLLCLAHSSASTDSPHVFASSALGSYTLAGGSCFEIFYWFRCSGFVSTAHCTGKKGAYSLSASLSSRGCSWSKHARHAVYARGMDGSNSTAFSACLQKGNFEHNSEFHRNMVPAVLPLP